MLQLMIIYLLICCVIDECCWQNWWCQISR